MNLTIRTIIAASLLFLTGANIAFGQRHVFSPKDRSFTVEFPYPPKCECERVDIIAEVVEMHLCVYANVPAQQFYALTYFDRPRSLLRVDDKAALMAARDWSLLFSNSRLVSEREISVGGYPALECVKRTNDINMESTTQYVLTNRWLVLVDVSGQPGKLPDSVVRGFLDSLRFKPHKRVRKRR